MRRLSIAALTSLCVVAAATLADLALIRATTLQADTHHVQGIESDGSHLWVSSVDAAQRKGYLYEFRFDSGVHVRTVDVTDGERYHPGGIASDGALLWIPVAEYRRASSSVVEARNLRTLEVEHRFAVDDHIGCIAAAGEELIGANWDSREFYVWDRRGALIRKMPNPAAVAYQDMKFVRGQLIASGLLADRTGAIDWLEYPSLRLVRRITTDKTSRGVPYTNEGMAIRAGRLLLLPEDSPSRLFEFRLPAPAPN